MAIIRDSVFALAMTVISMSWLVAGLFLNVAQLMAFLLLRPLSRKLYRYIIYMLTYCMWSPLVAIAEHGAGFCIRVWFADEQSQRHFGQEHMIGESFADRISVLSCSVVW
jgi:lysophosphatidic acid acyltransferase/lysophosphatidylinositol acyltransferase